MRQHLLLRMMLCCGDPAVDEAPKWGSAGLVSVSNWSKVIERGGLAHCKSKQFSATDLHQSATIFSGEGQTLSETPE